MISRVIGAATLHIQRVPAQEDARIDDIVTSTATSLYLALEFFSYNINIKKEEIIYKTY